MKSQIIALVMAAAGVAAIHHSRTGVMGEARSRPLNPLELKESPYGEVIGMALQDPVHLIWHGGRGHEHIDAQNQSKKNEEAEVCEVCGVVHDHADEDHVDEAYLENRPFWVQWKGKLLLMEKYTRFDHSPVERQGAVKEFERHETERLLKLAYDMDPTNYGNYNAYNYFYMVGKDVEDSRKRISELAHKSLAACELGKRVDPMDALTAAAAAEDLMIWVMDSPGETRPENVVSAYWRFADEVKNYEEVFDAAVNSGRINNYSQDRVSEMIQRYRLFNYNVREYGKKVEGMPKIYRY